MADSCHCDTCSGAGPDVAAQEWRSWLAEAQYALATAERVCDTPARFERYLEAAIKMLPVALAAYQHEQRILREGDDRA